MNRKISISKVQKNSERPSMPTAGPTVVTCSTRSNLRIITLVAKVSSHLSNQVFEISVEQGYNQA